MIEFAKLELRKNRLLFIGMTLTFLGSLPLVCIGMAPTEIPVRQGLNAALLFWTILGLPVMAALFGAASGAAMRSAPAREAESPLPISPSAKAAGALGASAVHLFLLCALVLVSACLLSPAVRQTIFFSERSALLQEFYFWLLGFTMTYLLMTSFACAYGLGHGILGGVLGGALGIIAVGSLSWGFGLQEIYVYRAPFTARGIAAIVIALTGAAVAIARISAWVERRPRWGWSGLVLTAIAVSAGSVTASGALWSTHSRLIQSLFLVSSEDHYLPWLSRRNDKAFLKEGRSAASRGALAKSLNGGLEWISPKGERSIILKPLRRNVIRWSLLPFPWWGGLASVIWDENGTLWALVEDPGDKMTNEPANYQLWKGTPPRPMTLHLRVEQRGHEPNPYSFAQRGREVGVLAFAPGDKVAFAPLRKSERRLEWEDTGKHRTLFLLDGWKKEGLAAAVDSNGTGLRSYEPTPRRWKLPGRARALYDVVRALPVAGKGFFLVPVETAGGSRALAVCGPDGEVRKVWEAGSEADFWLEIGQDGSLWGWRDRHTLHLVTPKGVFLPPLSMRMAAREVLGMDSRKSRWRSPVVRLTETRVWVILDHRFMVMLDNRTGEVIKKWSLPSPRKKRHYQDEALHPAEDGVFYHTGRRLHFMDWAGNPRDLGPA